MIKEKPIISRWFRTTLVKVHYSRLIRVMHVYPEYHWDVWRLPSEFVKNGGLGNVSELKAKRDAMATARADWLKCRKEKP